MNSAINHCLSKVTGKPLKSFRSELEAEQGAKYVWERYRNEVVPYRCTDCGYWHLSPKKNHTPSRKCTCLGASGRPKALYRSREDAINRAEIIRQQTGRSLRVYECPHYSGWHLTKGGCY